jgi:hypothetical protein
MINIGDLVVRKGDWVTVNAFLEGTELDDTDRQAYGLVINTGLDEFKEPAAHVVWLEEDKQSIEQQINLEVINEKQV